ncbi:hypothetical protein [Microaceticoccus formicicus]|nr:hypothetical protein VZL98_11865 [Peptoniphilaceae bacterium AMB_02]
MINRCIGRYKNGDVDSVNVKNMEQVYMILFFIRLSIDKIHKELQYEAI